MRHFSFADASYPSGDEDAHFSVCDRRQLNKFFDT